MDCTLKRPTALQRLRRGTRQHAQTQPSITSDTCSYRSEHPSLLTLFWAPTEMLMDREQPSLRGGFCRFFAFSLFQQLRFTSLYPVLVIYVPLQPRQEAGLGEMDRAPLSFQDLLRSST